MRILEKFVSLPRLLWLDVETTGLDLRDHLLEVGLVVTDENLNAVDQASRVLHIDGHARERSDPVVQDMHDKNGLWVECAHSNWHSLSDLFEPLFDRWWPDPKDQVVLAGRNVASFDRRWLERHAAPSVLARFHHRHLDLTTFRILGVEVPKPAYEPHRALFDCYREIGNLRRLLD